MATRLNRIHVHADNRRIVVRDKDDVAFNAAITHVETGGKRLVVIAAADTDLPRLRECAPAMIALIARANDVAPSQIAYHERGRDGAAFHVSSRAAGQDQRSVTGLRRPGRWVDEQALSERLGPAHLPYVDQSVDLAEAYIRMAPDERRGVRQQAESHALASDLPELPRHRTIRF